VQTDADLLPGRRGRPKPASPPGRGGQRHPAMCSMSYDWFLIAKREHFLAPEVPELKINVCAGLRESAAENVFSRRRTPTFARPTWPGKNAKPFGQGQQRQPAMCSMSYDWFLIAKREHLLAPEVPELKINVCAGLRESAAENEFNRRLTPTFVRPTWPAKNAKPSGIK
jgi:hypothetical protein